MVIDGDQPDVRSAGGSAGQTSADAAGGWREAFASGTAADFASAFAPGVSLRASVLVTPIHGRDVVSQVMATAGGIYDQLRFTHHAHQAGRTYLEWQASFDGVEVAGISVLARDANGLIIDVAIHHRPLNAALGFSTELRNRLGHLVDPSHFYSGG
jgi:hypothetical protein